MLFFENPCSGKEEAEPQITRQCNHGLRLPVHSFNLSTTLPSSHDYPIVERLSAVDIDEVLYESRI
jgi:hypothetical protein